MMRWYLDDDMKFESTQVMTKGEKRQNSINCDIKLSILSNLILPTSRQTENSWTETTCHVFVMWCTM